MMSATQAMSFTNPANFKIDTKEVISYIQGEINRNLFNGSRRIFACDSKGSYVIENFGAKTKKFYIDIDTKSGDFIYKK